MKKLRVFWYTVSCCVFLSAISVFLCVKKNFYSSVETERPATRADKLSVLDENLLIEKELLRVFSHCFGYTLVGAKPASIEYCCGSDFTSDPACRKKFFHLLQTLFEKSNRFVLKMFHVADNYFSEIILIDVPSLIAQIKKNQYLSNFVQQHYGSMQKLYKALKAPQLHIIDCFRRDLIAIGITLGYGEENSRYYDRYLEVGFYLRKYPIVLLFPFDPKSIPEMIPRALHIPPQNDVPYTPIIPRPPTDTFSSLEEEWRWIRKVGNKDCEEVDIPCLFPLPYFISKKCPETEKLCKHYDKARTKLAELICKGNLREAIADEIAKRELAH